MSRMMYDIEPQWRLEPSTLWLRSGNHRLYYWHELGQGVLSSATAVTIVEHLTRAGALPSQLVAMNAISPEQLHAAIEELSRCRLITAETGACDLTPRYFSVVPHLTGQPRIVVIPDYLSEQTASEAEFHRTAKQPWMPVKLSGQRLWAGPCFTATVAPSGNGSCYWCLAERLREHRFVEAQMPLPLSHPAPQYWNDDRAARGLDLVHKWLVTNASRFDRTLIVHDWNTGHTIEHAVARRPGCSHCATRANPQHSPEHLSQSLERLASPITGILRAFTESDSSGVHKSVASHVAALPPRELRTPGAFLSPGVAAGRGFTRDAARLACLAEAAERYSFQFRGEEPRTRASFTDLASEAIDPRAVLLFSPSQMQRREDWNRSHTRNEAVPEPFDPDEPIEWYAGRSLTRDVTRMLPMAACFQNYLPPQTRWIADADATGCAAGASVEDAAGRSLLELIERDARAIWWFNQIELPAFRLDACAHPVLNEFGRMLRTRGFDPYVHDLTTDLGVPVAAVIATSQTGAWAHGFAAGLTFGIALQAATAELLQLIDETPRRGTPPAVARWVDPPPLTFELSQEDTLAVSGRALEHAGLEVILFDLTRSDIGVPVVRAVVPGLRPSKPRLAAGRLFDVPVTLGWRSFATPEEEMPRFAP